MKSKIQKNLITCSYGYKLVYVDNKFSKSFKTYLSEQAVYNYTNNLIEESKYCSDRMKKHFNKEIMITKEQNENLLENVGSVTMIMLIMMLK